MNIDTRQKAQALKSRIEKLSVDILAQDGLARDLDPFADAVTLHSGPSDALTYPVGLAYKEEVVSARVTGSGNGEVLASYVDTREYFDGSSGRGPESGYTLEKQKIGGKQPVTVYRQRYFDPMGTNNSKSEARFNAAGEPVGWKHKEFAATWGEAVKEVFTSPVGLALVGLAGLLGGCPGAIGFALAGSAWPGLLTAGAAAAGLVYNKTRPWSPE